MTSVSSEQALVFPSSALDAAVRLAVRDCVCAPAVISESK